MVSFQALLTVLPITATIADNAAHHLLEVLLSAAVDDWARIEPLER